MSETEYLFIGNMEVVRKDKFDALNQRIAELTHKNEVLMDSYLESETINDKGQLVGSLEFFRKRIAELEEHIEKTKQGAIFLGHPKEYWLSLNRYAYDGGYEKLIQDNAYHVCANEIAVKRIAYLEEQLRWRPVWTPPEKSGYYEVEFDNGNLHDMIFYNEHYSWRCSQEHVNITGWRPIPELEVKHE